MQRAVEIARRFRGPAESGNGGYTAGLVASAIEGTATVTLRVPPPLDRPLELVGDGSRVELIDGGRVVADAAASVLELDVPALPDFGAAAAAWPRYRGFAEHGYPTCFVCGPSRATGDGLRIFPGPVAGFEGVATTWQPGEDLASGGQVDPIFVWSALDCPSYWGLGLRRDALLGMITTRIDRLPGIGEPLVVAGWSLGVKGRKLNAASALATGDGEVLARAQALWIALEASGG